MFRQMVISAAVMFFGANALAQGPPAGAPRFQILKDVLDLSDDQVRKLQDNQNAQTQAVSSAVEETRQKHREQALAVLSAEQQEKLDSIQAELRQRLAGSAAAQAAALNLIEQREGGPDFRGGRPREGFRPRDRYRGRGGRSVSPGRGFGGRPGFRGFAPRGRFGFRGRRPGTAVRFDRRRPDDSRGRWPRGRPRGDQQPPVQQ